MERKSGNLQRKLQSCLCLSLERKLGDMVLPKNVFVCPREKPRQVTCSINKYIVIRMIRRADLLYKSGREWDGCKGESGRAGEISGGHSAKFKNIHVFNHMFHFLLKSVETDFLLMSWTETTTLDQLPYNPLGLSCITSLICSFLNYFLRRCHAFIAALICIGNLMMI